eukprot:TRINITY_DN1448_c0_g1_i1.p1 TRINITY_DN1448_c0_g1~~TRINITY_DN1448_c0_g1_i1.p1  ORF type:complete len:235 (-),score=30.05 TRINITY_DN1448_c0_g1_i1:2-706(-)
MNGTVKLLCEAGAGTAFEENALMVSSPRGATVQASKPSIVWCLDASSFREVEQGTSAKPTHLSRLKKFLQTKVPILKALPAPTFDTLAKNVQEVSFRDKTTIIHQGDPSNYFYIIQQGTAIVKKAPPNSSPDNAVLVNKYKEGGYFGERGLLLLQPRAATVIATSDIKCLVMTASDLASLLTPLRQNFLDVIASYQAVDEEPDPGPPRQKLPPIDSLINLGVGRSSETAKAHRG